jgi:hypothetical protein
MRSLLGDLPAEVSALVELAELTGLDESDSSGGDSGGACSDVTVRLGCFASRGCKSLTGHI